MMTKIIEFIELSLSRPYYVITYYDVTKSGIILDRYVALGQVIFVYDRSQ